jgi:AraC-like DNA-binding protein
MRPGALADGIVEDANYRLPTRLIAGASLVIYVVRGEGWFRSGNLEGPFRPGTLISAPAGPLDCEVGGDLEAVVVTVRDLHEGADDAEAFTVPFIRRLSRDDGATWHIRLRAIVELAENDRVQAEHIRALKCDLSPLVWLKRAPYVRETLSDVFGLLWKRQADPLSLNQLAAATGYTPNYLNDLMRTHTGRPVGRWIADIRMARARHELEYTNLQIADVGASCGYDDPAYFSRTFRRLHGVPPAIWRIARQAGSRGGGPFAVMTDDLKRETLLRSSPLVS